MNEELNESAPAQNHLDDYVRENPVPAILFALGAGLIIAVVVRALQPPPTIDRRAARLLEDLQERLSELAAPAVRHAGRLAREGAGLAQDGAEQLADLHLDRKVNGAIRKVRSLLHC